MLAKRIIPCLDVKDGQVVKGVQFRNHEIIGDIVPLAQRYAQEGADELVFYDITASSDGRVVDKSWVSRVAEVIDIPFCVAGGIKSAEDASQILSFGADKISVNSPALADPELISRLAERFGVQCIVVGIDTWFDSETGKYHVNQYTGDESRTRITQWETLDWVQEVQRRGAGEIVLNMMNQDGVRNGYDLQQLRWVREACKVPLIASGGAGTMEHFLEAFRDADVATPAFVASDLLSQAEHGPDSQVILLTPDAAMAQAVAEAVESQLAELPRADTARQALASSRLIVARDLTECVAISNRYGPEHLIIQTRNARELVDSITSAGSVFLGDWSPESAGDYASGTNHVLPTYGYTATCSSLGLADFQKRMTVQELTPQGFSNLAATIETLAAAEQLIAHKNAVTLRVAALKEQA